MFIFCKTSLSKLCVPLACKYECPITFQGMFLTVFLFDSSTGRNIQIYKTTHVLVHLKSGQTVLGKILINPVKVQLAFKNRCTFESGRLRQHLRISGGRAEGAMTSLSIGIRPKLVNFLQF